MSYIEKSLGLKIAGQGQGRIQKHCLQCQRMDAVSSCFPPAHNICNHLKSTLLQSVSILLEVRVIYFSCLCCSRVVVCLFVLMCPIDESL